MDYYDTQMADGVTDEARTMNGVVISKLYGALGPYGFIRDEDGVGRFFMPSLLAGAADLSRDDQVEAFALLKVGTRVAFVPMDHVKGPRAAEVIAAPTGTVDLAD